MSDQHIELPVRLAIRAEGERISAYMARPDTMEDARWISSIDRGCAENGVYFEQWKDFCVGIMSDAVHGVFGETPTIKERTNHLDEMPQEGTAPLTPHGEAEKIRTRLGE